MSCLRCRDSARTSCESKLQNLSSLDNARLYKLGLYDVPAVKMRQDELNGGNFSKVFFGGLAAN